MPSGVWSRLAWLCVAGLVLGGCAAQPTITVAPDAWQFERRAIHLQIKADPALNQAYGQAHTLVLGVFQLKDPASFTSLGALREGALQLLAKGFVDDTVADFTRVTVAPGETRDVWLDRAAQAQYLGVIAGYYKLNVQTDVHSFGLPVGPVPRSLLTRALVLAKLKADEVEARPVVFVLTVELGADGVIAMLPQLPEDAFVPGAADAEAEKK